MCLMTDENEEIAMKELYAGTRAEFDQGVRIFLLVGEKTALLIDTGMTGIELDSMVRAHTSLPYQVLNTHADRDHIAGNSGVEAFYMHPAEAAFYRNVQHGNGKMMPVFEGDLIDLGGRVFEIIHLPGHTPGSITVLDRANRCLIGGDPIQEDGDIFMFGDHRDMEAYIASLMRLEKRNDFDWIYPSHAKEKVSRNVIPKLIDGAQAVLDRRISGIERDMFGKKVLSYDAGVARFLCELR